MRYQVFGKTGLRVSSFALGTGNFGTGWGYGSTADEARSMYSCYRDAGGNFIDTADQYQFGQSESLLGELIGPDREDLVVATKYSLGATANAGVMRTGNSRKAMVQCVEDSLRRLRTDRVDLLWVHMPDGVTPVEEIARGFDDLVRAGKVLYGGLSDFPAWRIATAATIADLRGWVPLAAVQLEYSLVERTAERELLPMAHAFALGIVGWSPLGGGLLTGKYRKGETGRVQGLGAVVHTEDDARKTAILDAVLSIAARIGEPAGRIALAWVRRRGVLPILGPRTRAQLEDNLASGEIALSAEDMGLLDQASAVPPGFPHDVVARAMDR